MRVFGVGLALTLFAAAAMAQEPAGQPSAETMKTFASSADVEALMAKAKGDLKGQYAVAENLLRSGPYRVNLEYRVGLHRSTIHENETEIFYVLDGSGTLMLGGKLVNEKREGTNRHGTAIEGGKPQNLAKGDFIRSEE